MLSWDYIKSETLWVVKWISGGRTVKRGADINLFVQNNANDIDEHDIITWKGQPKELQEFYKAYEYAIYVLNRKDLFFVKDFYDEWKENPDQFKEDHSQVISTLWAELEKLDFGDGKLNVIVSNYDHQTAGNHYLKNWLDTKRVVDTDFDVIETRRRGDTLTIIIQTDDQEAFDKLDYTANRIAIRNENIW